MFMENYAPNRCEPRIEVIVKMQNVKKKLGSGPVGVGGVKVDVSQELKLLCKCKKVRVVQSGGGRGGPVGVRVDM